MEEYYQVCYRTYDGRYHKICEYESLIHAESQMRCALMAGFHCAAVVLDGDVIIERSHLPVFPDFDDNKEVDWKKEGF